MICTDTAGWDKRVLEALRQGIALLLPTSTFPSAQISCFLLTKKKNNQTILEIMFYKVFVPLFCLGAVAAQLPEGLYRIYNAESGTTVRSNVVGAPLFVSTDTPPVLYELVGFRSFLWNRPVDLTGLLCLIDIHVVGGNANSQKPAKYLHLEEYRPGRMGKRCKYTSESNQLFPLPNGINLSACDRR